MSTATLHPSPECPCAECRRSASHDMREGMLAAATHDPESVTVNLLAACGSRFQVRANGAMLAIGDGDAGFLLGPVAMVFPQEADSEGRRGRVDLDPTDRAEMVFQLRDLASILYAVAGSIDLGASPIAAVVAIATARLSPAAIGEAAPFHAANHADLVLGHFEMRRAR